MQNSLKFTIKIQLLLLLTLSYLSPLQAITIAGTLKNGKQNEVNLNIAHITQTMPVISAQTMPVVSVESVPLVSVQTVPLGVCLARI